MKSKTVNSKSLGVESEPINEAFEKLNLAMQQGYVYEFAGEPDKAIKEWKKVFKEVKAYFAEHKGSDLKTFDELLNGTEFVYNWVQDYDEVLRNRLVSCSEDEKQQLGSLKIELLTFLLSLNIKDALNEANQRRSLAETYYLIGQPDVGERYYTELIEAYPDDVWGYVGYSDEYWMGKSEQLDFEKAFKILNEAYNRVTINESEIIVERLTNLTIAKKKKELEDYIELEKELALGEDTTVSNVIDQLRRKTKAVPLSYLKFIENNKKVALPLILEEMASYIKAPDHYALNNGLLALYLPFILAQWEEKGSSRDLIDLVACSEESIDLRIGDAITEEYPVVLYRCFDGDLSYLKSVIGREHVGTFSKLAYLRALSVYYIENLNDIEGLKVYLQNLLNDQPELATRISSIVLMHKREALLSVGKRSVESEFYDPTVNGNWSDYQVNFHNASRDETVEYKKSFNAIETLNKWRLISDEKPVVPEYGILYQKLFNAREKRTPNSIKKTNLQYHHEPIITGKKIGRNDPCPCGSGKKYKKCCGNYIN
ncbi:DUF1186 domain-containing protein [Fusibacter sp. 3D3]|uniref:DUF1186 domain-containing protein n=1 Tax=Fusibacter sp. 3D3 TaxID=1048380 RepID=UPI001585E324